MCRGNQGQRIFSDDQDCQRYLGLLKESQTHNGYRLYKESTDPKQHPPVQEVLTVFEGAVIKS